MTFASFLAGSAPAAVGLGALAAAGASPLGGRGGDLNPSTHVSRGASCWFHKIPKFTLGQSESGDAPCSAGTKTSPPQDSPNSRGLPIRTRLPRILPQSGSGMSAPRNAGLPVSASRRSRCRWRSSLRCTNGFELRMQGRLRPLSPADRARASTATKRLARPKSRANAQLTRGPMDRDRPAWAAEGVKRCASRLAAGRTAVAAGSVGHRPAAPIQSRPGPPARGAPAAGHSRHSHPPQEATWDGRPHQFTRIEARGREGINIQPDRKAVAVLDSQRNAACGFV